MRFICSSLGFRPALRWRAAKCSANWNAALSTAAEKSWQFVLFETFLLASLQRPGVVLVFFFFGQIWNYITKHRLAFFEDDISGMLAHKIPTAIFQSFRVWISENSEGQTKLPPLGKGYFGCFQQGISPKKTPPVFFQRKIPWIPSMTSTGKVYLFTWPLFAQTAALANSVEGVLPTPSSRQRYVNPPEPGCQWEMKA